MRLEAGWAQGVNTALIANTKSVPVRVPLAADIYDRAGCVSWHVGVVYNSDPEGGQSTVIFNPDPLLDAIAYLHPAEAHFSFQ